MIAVGVDPGLSGAIAAVCSRRGLLEARSLPTCSNGSDGLIERKVDARALHELLRGWSTRHGFAGEHLLGAVERMQPFTGGGSAGHRGAATPTTLLSMGHSAGICEAVLHAFCHGVLQPLPRQWKAGYGLGKDKAAAVDVARRVFVQTPRQFRHDLAEASLIAHWALGSINGPTLTPATTEECAFP